MPPDAERMQAMLTEAVNPTTHDLDLRPAEEIVTTILNEEARVAEAVARQAGKIAALAEIVAARLARGGRLIYVGAGTSGRLGALDAAELPPTYRVDPAQVCALIAGGPAALTQAVEAAEDDAEQGARDIAAREVTAGDVVVGISASGRTPYVIGAVDAARARGAFTAGLTCNHPSQLAEHVDLTIAVIVGPEVIAGSTRMKAGTAQKLTLNALSTTAMILLGKTYGNLMVDLLPTNQKLWQRATRIVAQATGLDETSARELLERANGEAKTAIVMALAGVDAPEARRRLAQTGGRIRRALELTSP